jgi:N-methylhydantoinase A/oxoprolinase/acetone carboxylase beta subunit
MKLHEAFSSEESKKIYDNFLAIVNDPKRRDRLVRTHGKNAENVAYGTAVNQVKKQAANNVEQPTTEEPMDKETKLKEMIQAALSKPLSEKKVKPDYPDIDKDGDREESMKKAAQDKKKMQMEDMDLGHEDDEPHMLKADLYRIGKYAMELYKMVDQFEGEQEVDFPHWWQAKIIQAKSMLVSAKHYLDFEIKEPQLDAMVDVASEEGAIDEEMTPEKSKKIGMPFKNKIKEAILAKLK